MKLTGFLAAFAILLSATSALACSCRPPEPQTLAEIKAAGIVVVMGHVAAVEKTGGADINSGNLVYRIEIASSVNLPEMATMSVHSAPNGALCGINLPINSFQILFVYQRDQIYWASLCGNSVYVRSEGQARQIWRDFKAGGTLPPRR